MKEEHIMHHAQSKHLWSSVEEALKSPKRRKTRIARRYCRKGQEQCAQELRPEEDGQAAVSLNQWHSQYAARTLQEDTAGDRVRRCDNTSVKVRCLSKEDWATPCHAEVCEQRGPDDG